MEQDSRIKKLRARALAKGMPIASFELVLRAFGPEAAEEVVSHYGAVKELRAAYKSLGESSSKVMTMVDVTPEQIDAMAKQVGVDPKGGLWAVLTRENTPERLYELLIRAGAKLDTTKEKAERTFWFGDPDAARKSKPAKFWPTE